MAWPEVVFLLNGDARSRNFSCLTPFFNLPLYAQKGEKTSNYSIFLLLPTAGIKPELPAQQASALSITPLPLGRLLFHKFVHSSLRTVHRIDAKSLRQQTLI